MSTTNVTVTSASWTSVSIVDNLLANKSSYPVKIHYGITAPALDTEDFIPLKAGDVISRLNGVPAGNTYVLAFDGRTSDVAVAE